MVTTFTFAGTILLELTMKEKQIVNRPTTTGRIAMAVVTLFPFFSHVSPYVLNNPPSFPGLYIKVSGYMRAPLSSPGSQASSSRRYTDTNLSVATKWDTAFRHTLAHTEAEDFPTSAAHSVPDSAHHTAQGISKYWQQQVDNMIKVNMAPASIYCSLVVTSTHLTSDPNKHQLYWDIPSLKQVQNRKKVVLRGKGKNSQGQGPDIFPFNDPTVDFNAAFSGADMASWAQTHSYVHYLEHRSEHSPTIRPIGVVNKKEDPNCAVGCELVVLHSSSDEVCFSCERLLMGTLIPAVLSCNPERQLPQTYGPVWVRKQGVALEGDGTHKLGGAEVHFKTNV